MNEVAKLVFQGRNCTDCPTSVTEIRSSVECSIILFKRLHNACIIYWMCKLAAYVCLRAHTFVDHKRQKRGEIVNESRSCNHQLK